MQALELQIDRVLTYNYRYGTHNRLGRVMHFHYVGNR